MRFKYRWNRRQWQESDMGCLWCVCFLEDSWTLNTFPRPWWRTDGHMAQTVLGKTSEIPAPFRILAFTSGSGPIIRTESQPTGPPRWVWLLLTHSAPAPSAPPSQVISWAPSLHHFCACDLPAQDDPPDSVHLECGHHTAGKSFLRLQGWH